MSLQNASINITEFIIGGFDTTKRPIIVGVVILIIYVLAVLANILNILFIIYDKRLHKPMYLLICNLAVVDILYNCSCPTMIGVLVAGVNTISYVPCLIQMFVYHLGAVMEMFALSVMAFDRLIAFSYPFHYHSYLTNVRTLVLTCILWIVACSFVAVLPATLLPLPHCDSKLKYTFCELGVILTLEARHGLTIGSIIAHPLLNPLVYCLRTKEMKCKIFRIFKKVETSQ
ncbi:putative olfactory receptor 13C6 [Sander lucioperca]|uniref:putative olfactory receptor 13C6 n=1 Tax=Sander lucioperca TaxID=283035 RepID=UPI00165351DA|nr:putative olfactory receptor 13C6 [Sander lucioperca]